MRKGRSLVNGRPMTADDVKFVFRLPYSTKTIRTAMRELGSCTVAEVEARCAEIVAQVRKDAGAKIAQTIKAKFEREESATPVPAHDYTLADRVMRIWRGPADGRLYGMVL